MSKAALVVERTGCLETVQDLLLMTQTPATMTATVSTSTSTPRVARIAGVASDKAGFGVVVKICGIVALTSTVMTSVVLLAACVGIHYFNIKNNLFYGLPMKRTRTSFMPLIFYVYSRESVETVTGSAGLRQ